MNIDKSSQEFFDSLYEKNSDPWNFRQDLYENNRYEIIYKLLSQKRYHYAFEPGCSIGILTQKLAKICDHVEAIDISPTAAEIAKQHCKEFQNVSIECRSLSQKQCHPKTDLIVLSEIAYYYSEEALGDMVHDLLAQLCAPVTFLASHWLGKSEDHLISGDVAHQIMRERIALPLKHSARYEQFRIDLWESL